MAYIAPIHRPNSVRYALRIKLYPDEDECLVIAKTNRLEIWKSTEEGTIVFADSKQVNGTICFIQKLNPRDEETNLLLVGTDRFHYFTVGWDSALSRLTTIQSFFDKEEKHMRDAQSQDKCIVDPTGQFMVMLLWEGVLNVLRLYKTRTKRLELDWRETARISELFIRSATFLHSETGHPQIAFLYQTRTDIPDAHIVIYKLFKDDKNTEASRFEQRDREDFFEVADPGAAILIPVGKGEEDQKRYGTRNPLHAQAQLGGFIVVCETRLVYYDHAAKKKIQFPLKESSIFVAWAEYDVSHYFVGDDYGNLWLLEILLDGAVVTGIEMAKLGVTSRASTLVTLGNNLLFVGSHYGDSQVFLVDIEAKSLQLTQTLANIAPILDLSIMDLGNREGDGQTTNEYSSGQARIVTGSGAHKDGSLRSVRSGVGLEDIGILGEMENIRGVYALKSHGSGKDDTLVVSFLTETRVFSFDADGDVEELGDFKGLTLDAETLLARNLPGGLMLQVTSQGAYLLNLEGGMVEATWKPSEGSITSVSANNERILLSVDGGLLQALRVQGLTPGESSNMGKKDQVACIHLPEQYPNIGVVGFWSSGSISIVDIATLQPLQSESLRRKDDNASVPRDIVLAQILPPQSAGPTLFVSMEDGFVFSFNVSTEDFQLSGRKSIVLGTRHARLQTLSREEGIYNIFSISEHPSLIYGAEGRIVFSAVEDTSATCVCQFDSEAFPDSLVVATDKELKISVIDSERRTHVTPLAMGETVRRIAYSRSERVFGLGCIRREIVDNEEVVSSSFKLVDEVSFQSLGQEFKLGITPAVEMIEAVIRAELPDSYGHLVERFIVGTSFVEDEQTSNASRDEIRGRLLVLGIDSERRPYIVAKKNLKGACRVLDVMEDKIVASLAKTVIVYSYNETSTTTAELSKLATYRPVTYPVDMVVEGHTIAVGDLMKSMVLVEFTPAAEGKPAKLTEVARHYQAAWSTAVCHIEDQTWLEAESAGNLMVLKKNEGGVTVEDRHRLQLIGELNLGEMVNKIRKITVDARANAIVVPKAFLGTVEGGVYMFGTISDNYQDLLLRFQTNMASITSNHVVDFEVGSIHFDAYRSFRNSEREGEAPFRFVDGDLLERFLDLPDELQEQACAGLGPSVEDMRTMVEDLKQLH
ncbi:mono-functional DNA-alkylating methyl methanesulfonate N-term-domain-containing protein [Microdochium trichocladiopsis]|uniref:DNA damage-binding protein 1 n=1 Tax=Microdochium trichocladiopsis TaxID=1682393 RepID=A0A9P8YC27_9PEZI|nr:mono-functional DNA-alkylating methyl methanesulfonate N-term-domain-containing protein [Microdochium trichocladiopsis]KAH7035527.1 mono-functional DNA-alkylating methyl methanesulfonate N-term-domain-containing protein [Microdochium trichocladiopsis]